MRIFKIVLSENIYIVCEEGNIHTVTTGCSNYAEDLVEVLESFSNCTNYFVTAPENKMEIMVAYDDLDGNGVTTLMKPCDYTGIWERV